MESATPYILFFSGISVIGSFVIGLIVGWFGNDIIYAFLNKNRIQPLHPEMFDENGQLIPDEIVAVRFENTEDFEDYDNED
jgi:hypothetical protein